MRFFKLIQIEEGQVVLSMRENGSSTTMAVGPFYMHVHQKEEEDIPVSTDWVEVDIEMFRQEIGKMAIVAAKFSTDVATFLREQPLMCLGQEGIKLAQSIQSPTFVEILEQPGHVSVFMLTQSYSDDVRNQFTTVSLEDIQASWESAKECLQNSLEMVVLL